LVDQIDPLHQPLVRAVPPGEAAAGIDAPESIHDWNLNLKGCLFRHFGGSRVAKEYVEESIFGGKREYTDTMHETPSEMAEVTVPPGNRRGRT